MGTKGGGKGDVCGIAPIGYWKVANTPFVVSDVEPMPFTTQINFHACAEIHGIWIGGYPNIAEVARDVTCRDVHTAAKCDRQMGEVAADAHLGVAGLFGRTSGISLGIIEA